MHPALPRSALRRDRWRTTLNTTRRRNPEPTYSPRERIVGIPHHRHKRRQSYVSGNAPPEVTRVGPRVSSAKRGREGRPEIEQDDAVLGR